MQIIDRKTGKRLVDTRLNKELKEKDPVKRNVEKGLEGKEMSPMDPPDAYRIEQTAEKVTYGDMSLVLRGLMDEHNHAIQQADLFEKTLGQFRANGYRFDPKINEVFGTFFKFFDNNLLVHNTKEEKVLFPLLEQRLLECGEHSLSDNPTTAIDIMEDDHIKFIQLGTLTFNLMGLASRLQDQNSRMTVFDLACSNGRELTELLRLHIFREDNTLFPMAHKLISTVEFAAMEDKMDSFQ